MDLRLDEAFIGSFSNALGPCHALLHVLLVSSLLRFAALDWTFSSLGPNQTTSSSDILLFPMTGHLCYTLPLPCACRTTWRCAATCAPTSTAEITSGYTAPQPMIALAPYILCRPCSLHLSVTCCAFPRPRHTSSTAIILMRSVSTRVPSCRPSSQDRLSRRRIPLMSTSWAAVYLHPSATPQRKHRCP